MTTKIIDIRRKDWRNKIISWRGVMALEIAALAILVWAIVTNYHPSWLFKNEPPIIVTDTVPKPKVYTYTRTYNEGLLALKLDSMIRFVGAYMGRTLSVDDATRLNSFFGELAQRTFVLGNRDSTEVKETINKPLK